MKPQSLLPAVVSEDSTSRPVAWLAIFLALLIPLSLTGCAFYQTHKEQITATTGIVVKRVAGIAGRVILNAAIGELTGTDADFLDSVATGLRTAQGTIVNSDDVAQLVQIWGKQGPQWQQLAGKLAAVYAEHEATTANSALLEAMATGLQHAAAEDRKP